MTTQSRPTQRVPVVWVHIAALFALAGLLDNAAEHDVLMVILNAVGLIAALVVALDVRRTS